MSTGHPQWQPPSLPPPDDAISIPTSSTTAYDESSTTTTAAAVTFATTDLNMRQNTDQTLSDSQQQMSKPLSQQPSSHSPGTTPRYSKAGMAALNARSGAIASYTGSGTQALASGPGAERPMGTPRCIVRIDRDHNIADESTRFEHEQFPEEFVDRVTRLQFKVTVEGINECMRDAEESMLNCLDTLLDCLTAYTAKYCFGTHYQRAIRRMEEFIEQENRRLYHPARMHLRDPQTVGMIYLEFEIF
ncbi:Golgin subfamily A member 7/ERF4 family-domain-containing protein [Dissophora ornata]|nr:Golgin subfamily A member 7/ERF4 family-domain-containing protein [Dissophora ornata]